MDNLLLEWFDATSARLLLQVVSGDGLTRAVVFLLVAARLAGFFCVGPLLGRAIVTWPVRLGLVGLLTLIVAPGLQVSYTNPATVMQVGHQTTGIARSEGSADAAVRSDWSSPIGLAVAVLCELVLGGTLGLAVAVFLSGLKLSGEWLDRHSGLGLGSVLNPEYSSGGSAPAELTFCFCVAVMLVMQPSNGHLLALRFVLDTFHAIPVGLSQLPQSVGDLMSVIVQQSLILGLRIAMPFVVAMALLDMTLGYVRRSSRWELAPAAFAFRSAAALLILAATFPGIQEAVTSSVLESLKLAGDRLVAAESSISP